MPLVPYTSSDEVRAAIGGSQFIRPEDYDRGVVAARQQIDRWCGRGFLQDAVASTREFVVVSCGSLCVGDFTDPSQVVVETDELGDDTWLEWDPSWWRPGADDRGNGRYAPLDGEPWRWIVPRGGRKFPISCDDEPRARATTRWGWLAAPFPVLQASMKLSIPFSQNTDQSPQSLEGDPIMLAQGMLMDYAVQGGTLCPDPLAP